MDLYTNEHKRELLAKALKLKEEINDAKKHLEEKQNALLRVEEDIENIFSTTRNLFWNGYIVHIPTYSRAGYNKKGIVFEEAQSL